MSFHIQKEKLDIFREQQCTLMNFIHTVYGHIQLNKQSTLWLKMQQKNVLYQLHRCGALQDFFHLWLAALFQKMMNTGSYSRYC